LPDKREAFCSLPPAREEPIKVAIVDDDGRARWFVRRILEQSGEFSCAGCYASGEAAIREVPKISPKVVLMEVRMPGISGIECTRRLKAMLPGLIVVLVSRLLDSQTMSKALQAGGDGYLTKPFSVAQCLATVKLAVRRSFASTPDSLHGDVLSARSGSECARLTNRETEVMNCLAKGLLYKETADKLGISFSAVHKHQRSIFLKLQAGNRTEALNKWHRSTPTRA